MKFIGKIELCEIQEDEVAGRAKLKMTGLKISNNYLDNNENGINWVKSYVEDNIKSAIGASYKVTFIDDDKTYPSGHGSMTYDDDGNISFPDSDTVGSIQDAYIENLTIDGENCDVLTTVGYIYKQSYPNFYEWLKEKKEDGEIYGSIEINGKGDSKKIIYDGKSINDDGTPFIGRKPKIFDIVSIVILSDFVPPADKFSRVLEINSKKENEMGKIKSSQTIELNELSYDDIACLITRAFNVMMAQKDDDYDSYYNYWIYKLYPDSKRVVMYKGYDSPNEYYLTTYEVSNKSIVLGDTTKVEQDWKPVNNEQEAEINASIIKNILKKNNKEVHKMEDNVILELNQKIENKTTEINELTTKNTGLANTNTELNEAVVNANKALEEANSKVTSLTDELNACKEELNALKVEKETAETEAKKVEVNSYFETEIPKNGFAEEEINSLKEYVEKIDLVGLKSAESELCAKKFKEMKLKDVEANSTEAEINSKNVSFITIHEKDKKVISDENVSFFN